MRRHAALFFAIAIAGAALDLLTKHLAFKYIQFNPNENFIFKISDDHNDHLQETAARLGKLREIIKRHEGDWSPISQIEKQQIDAALTVVEAQILAADSG